jgi:hypothetical protein
MTIIKTDLRTRATDHNGNIQINKPTQQAAFSGVYQLGLIMGSQDDETLRLPIPDSQLEKSLKENEPKFVVFDISNNPLTLTLHFNKRGKSIEKALIMLKRYAMSLGGA